MVAQTVSAESTPAARPPARRPPALLVATGVLTVAVAAVTVVWLNRSPASLPPAAVRVDAYFCQPADVPAPCAAPATPAQRSAGQAAARALPGVTAVRYISQQQAYTEFEQQFAGKPVAATVTVAQLPDSLRVTVSSTGAAQSVASSLAALPGVASAHAAVPPTSASVPGSG